MKKISLLVFALAISNFVSAAELNYPQDYKQEIVIEQVVSPITLKDGTYVGIGGGYDAYGIHQTADGSSFAIPFNLATNAQNFMGNLVVGYGRYYDRFYIAGEIIGTLSSASRQNFINEGPISYSESFRAKGGFGVAILPGFQLSSASLIYAKVGYQRTAFSLHESIEVFGGQQTDSSSRWQNGVQYGLGIETAVADLVSVRAEYTYTNYTSITSGFDNKFKISDNQFVLNLIYHLA